MSDAADEFRELLQTLLRLERDIYLRFSGYEMSKELPDVPRPMRFQSSSSALARLERVGHGLEPWNPVQPGGICAATRDAALRAGP